VHQDQVALRQDRVKPALQQDRAPHAQAARPDQPARELAHHAQALVEDQAALRVALQRAGQAQQVAVAAVLEQQVLLVRAVLAARLASQSAPREKNSNKEMHRASVAQWCHVVTATPSCVCAGEHRFRTLPTRLALTRVS
jgi:hypothetical protein